MRLVRPLEGSKGEYVLVTEAAPGRRLLVDDSTTMCPTPTSTSGWRSPWTTSAELCVSHEVSGPVTFHSGL